MEKQLDRLTMREAELEAQLADHAQDYQRLSELSAAYDALRAERELLEDEWLEAAGQLDQGS